LKSPEEKRLISTDRQNEKWSLVADKGYVGPYTDTPGLRKITPHKPAKLEAQKIENEEIKRIRIWVECFFGRMHMVYPFVRRPYPFSLLNFDSDIDNIILLTNEHIRIRSPVAREERKQYFEFLRQGRAERQLKKQKRVDSQQRYLRDKRKRREQFDHFE